MWRLGVDEVFQVISRKLVERRSEIERERLYGADPYGSRGGTGVDATAQAGEKRTGGACC